MGSLACTTYSTYTALHGSHTRIPPGCTKWVLRGYGIRGGCVIYGIRAQGGEGGVETRHSIGLNQVLWLYKMIAVFPTSRAIQWRVSGGRRRAVAAAGWAGSGRPAEGKATRD